MKRLFLLCASLTLPATAALASDSPWSGTWKLDAARRHSTGRTFTYAAASGDLLHYEDGSAESFDFGIDGKEYKIDANQTVTWTAAGKNAWDKVFKIEGKIRGKQRIELSEDAKTLHTVYIGSRADGSAIHDEETFTRLTGMDGLIGTWRADKVSEPPLAPTFVISAPALGVLRIGVPEDNESVEGPTDGSDNPFHGGPPKATFSSKVLSPTRLRYVFKIDGKTDTMGEWRLSADGAFFTDVEWNSGRENEKTTAVYVKQ